MPVDCRRVAVIREPSQAKEMSMAAVDEQNRLPDDVLEMTLSHLSITDAVNAALVCSRWRSLLSSSPSLPLTHANKPWLFVFGLNRPIVSARKQSAWGFDPLAGRWNRLPPLRLQSGGEDVILQEGNGVLLGLLEGSRMRYCSQMVSRKWHETPPMRRCRNHPVVTFVNHKNNNKLLLFVVGGVYSEFESEIEEESGSRGVEMYDLRSGEWAECPALPPHFKSSGSSTCMSSALLRGNQIYIWEKYSGDCCCFHLESMQWGSVVNVRRPPGVRSGSLLACADRLILAGLSRGGDTDGGLALSFELWSVNETSMDCRYLASMPGEILDSFVVDGEEEEDTMKVECRGMGDLVYVFLHHDCAIRHRNPPVCVCDLSGKDGIVWKKLPSLEAFSVNPSDRMVYMCSPVAMDQICLRQI